MKPANRPTPRLPWPDPCSEFEAAAAKQGKFTFRAAIPEDHGSTVSICKQSEYTSNFDSYWFSGTDAYSNGLIRVAEHNGRIFAVSCFEHRHRRGKLKFVSNTFLMFLAVEERLRGCGLGRLMMEDLETNSPCVAVTLRVDKRNEAACRFYERMGYHQTLRAEDLLTYTKIINPSAGSQGDQGELFS